MRRCSRLIRMRRCSGYAFKRLAIPIPMEFSIGNPLQISLWLLKRKGTREDASESPSIRSIGCVTPSLHLGRTQFHRTIPQKQVGRKSYERPVGTQTISRLDRGRLTEFFHVLPLLSEVSLGWIASCWRGSSKLAKRLRSQTDTHNRDIDKEELE